MQLLRTNHPNPVRASTLLACLVSLAVMLLGVAAAPAVAAHRHGKPSLSNGARVSVAHPHRRQRLRRLAVSRATQLGLSTAVSHPNPAQALLEGGFEQGLVGWNTAGVGEVMPEVTSAIARTGLKSCRVDLTGNQNRSELIFGGNGGASTNGAVEFGEGAEYWYGFSFNIAQMVYGGPGAHNLIMQFKSQGEGSPLFGLQLWDVNGEKGLWTAGEAMQIGNSGERFLAPVAEHVWHDVQIHFKASEVGQGFYEVFLDGRLVDARSGVTMIVPGTGSAYIKDGLYRNGTTAPGTSEIFLDSAKLGTSLAAVQPG